MDDYCKNTECCKFICLVKLELIVYFQNAYQWYFLKTRLSVHFKLNRDLMSYFTAKMSHNMSSFRLIRLVVIREERSIYMGAIVTWLKFLPKYFRCHQLKLRVRFRHHFFCCLGRLEDTCSYLHCSRIYFE